MDPTVQRTHGSPGSVRLAGMRMPAFSIRTLENPSASRCLRSAGAKRGGIGVHRVADLAVRAGIRRHGVDRVFRPARYHRQHDEAVPAVDLLGRGQAGLAPVRIDRGGLTAAAHLAARQHRAHARRQPFRGSQSRTRILPSPIDDGAERVGQHDGGIGGQAAPMAGMHAAGAQIARPGRNGTCRACRSRSSAPRASRAGRRCRSARRPPARRVCAATNSRRPIEPRSSQVSSTSFRLKPSLPPRSASTASSAERFSACWPLLSALPRPYQRSASSVSRHGSRPARH